MSDAGAKTPIKPCAINHEGLGHARWIEANGAVHRIALSGHAEPLLVLIHEIGGSLESWNSVAGLLGRKRRVLRYDLRGSGLSQKVRGKLDIGVLADDVAALIDAIGEPGKVSVAGCALGGAIAIQFAASYPTRVEALVASSPAVGIAPERRRALLDRADKLERDGAAADLDEQLEKSYPPVLRANGAGFHQVRLSRAAADPNGVAAQTRLLAELDMTASLGLVRCPALVLAGTHDLFRPPADVARTAASIDGALFTEIESGHLMAIQTPDLFVRELEAFLPRSRPQDGLS